MSFIMVVNISGNSLPKLDISDSKARKSPAGLRPPKNSLGKVLDGRYALTISSQVSSERVSGFEVMSPSSSESPQPSIEQLRPAPAFESRARTRSS